MRMQITPDNAKRLLKEWSIALKSMRNDRSFIPKAGTVSLTPKGPNPKELGKILAILMNHKLRVDKSL